MARSEAPAQLFQQCDNWEFPSTCLSASEFRHQLAPGQELVFRADVGGFDAGSQFSWNVLGAYSFNFAVRNGVTYAGLLGYRALSADFEKGSGLNRYEWDVVQHGPVLGLNIGF